MATPVEPLDERAKRIQAAIAAAESMPDGGFVPLTRLQRPLVEPPQVQAAQQAQKIYDTGMHNGYVTGVVAGVVLAATAGVGIYGMYRVAKAVWPASSPPAAPK